jgi:hypothetical protein
MPSLPPRVHAFVTCRSVRKPCGKRSRIRPDSAASADAGCNSKQALGRKSNAGWRMMQSGANRSPAEISPDQQGKNREFHRFEPLRASFSAENPEC